MKKSDTSKIIVKLMTVYPSFKFGANVLTGEDMDLSEIVNIWHEQIGDMEYEKADTAVNSCINKCKFVPSIAEIREEYEKINEKESAEKGAIRTYYQYACGSYPIDIPSGTGWDVWQERAKSGKQAEIFYKCIEQYLRELDGDAIDFVTCLKTICRGNDGKIFFKETV